MKGATVVGPAPGEGGALGAIDRAVHAVERGTALISGFGIFAMMMLGVVQIFSRKLFNIPILGYIDLVEIMMTFLVFLGLAYTERLGKARLVRVLGVGDRRRPIRLGSRRRVSSRTVFPTAGVSRCVTRRQRGQRPLGSLSLPARDPQ